MHRRASAILVTAFTVTCSWAWGVDSTNGDEAVEILNAVSDAYEGLTRYHLVARATSKHDDGEHDPEESETRMTFAYSGGGKMHAEIDGADGRVILVSDGETLWQYLPDSGEYTTQEVAELPEGAAEGIVLGFTEQYMRMTDTVDQAHIVAREMIQVGDREVDTVVLELTYKDGETPPELEGVVKRIWVDVATHMVAREQFTMHYPTSEGGSVRSDSLLELMRADFGDDVDDSLFSFSPPDGAREVDPAAAAAPSRPDLSGREAPDFTLKDGDGTEISLSSLRGKVVLLDFWATWCGPCRMVMPTLQKLHDEYADQGLLVYGVNSEEPTLVREFLTDHGYTFPTLRDPRSTAFMLYQAQSIPTTVLVGRDGIVVEHLIGAHPEENYRAALAKAGIE